MRLSKLEIYGFKSFAKRTEIIFPQNITGIVGPNGSGKSNISDAVRWVLGEQSAKTLRGNSMADIIFNGTQTKKPMNYCEVTLLFDNKDHQLPVEYADVSITRRVYRSGESEYLLNGATCRLKDIVDLFRDTGIGKEGYSIIGQGRIDAILSQRGEDRRSIFEEAAGISRFRNRKEDAEGRLHRADENLLRVLDVLEELQQHLVPLQRQAEVAKEFLALSEELKELDMQLFLLRHDRLTARAESVEQALSAAQNTLGTANLHLEEISAERDRCNDQVEELQQTLSAAHDSLLQKQELLHQARRQQATIEGDIQHGEETSERLQAEEEALRRRIALITATLTESEGGFSQADAQREAAAQALDEQKEAYASATQQADEWEAKLSAHKAAIIDSMSRMQDVRTAQARQSAMHSQMTTRLSEINAQLADGQAREIALQAAAQEAQETLNVEHSRYDSLKADVDALDEATRKMLADILEKQKLVQETAQSARELDTRLRTLRELQEGFEGYQHSVKNALQYAKRQNLRGVQGVVAMLLSVPQNIETAIDMALGGAMQNIVTDTEHDAKQMIEYLRQNRLGRATFLPLSTIRGRTLSSREREALRLPGCLGIASELVSFDERYRPVMENLLGRTIIAEDLDSGIAIMQSGGHSFRLVTLKGDVIHSGGSMTGGSIQQKAQNLLGREREMKELQKALTQNAILLQAEQEALSALESERASSKERREAAQYSLHQQEIAVVRDNERLQTAQQELSQHQDTMHSLRSAIQQLEESLQGVQNELQRLAGQEGAEEGSTQEMNARTEELAEALSVARRGREAAQDQLTTAMLHLQEAEHSCERLRRDKKRLAADSESCLKELTALSQKQIAVSQSIQQAAQALTQTQQSIAAMEQAAAEARIEVDATQKRRNEAQQKLKDLQGELDGGQKLLTRETERLHRQEMAQARVKAELAQLTDRLWDTYELTYAGAQEAAEAFRLLREEASGTSAQEKRIAPPPFMESEADSTAQSIRDRIRSMGTVNVGAIEEYAQMHERFSRLTTQKEDLQAAKEDLLTLIERLLKQMETVFVGQFSLLQQYFSETFTRLFGGGQGEIQLNDPSDPLNCGIEIIVQPPGKKRQLLSLFSGGERALTAIAILFAMLKLKPTPFCILDEIEAALDEANITYFADYLKEFSKQTQFIVVTHRKGTMERCDSLFGVAMEERGVSSMVSVNLTDYEES